MKVLMLLLLLLGLWEYAEGQTDCEQYISEYSGGILEESSSGNVINIHTLYATLQMLYLTDCGILNVCEVYNNYRELQ